MNSTRIAVLTALLLFLPLLAMAKEGDAPKRQGPEPAQAVLAPPKEGQVDVNLATPGIAQIRVWQQKKWVTVHNQRIDPRLRPEGAGVIYDPKTMHQYFDWKKGEKDPKGVTFVVIHQSHGWVALDGKTGKPIAGVSCLHYYHFLVDPKTAKVVKSKIDIEQTDLGPKPKPPAKPATDKVT